MVTLNTFPSENPLHPCSGLRFLLLKDAPSMLQNNYKTSPETSPFPPARVSSIHRQLTALCLHNPYWNDFRIVNHFQKRGIKMTLNDLEQLKKECNLDNPDTICNTLVRLSTHGGLKLNSRQVSYIERVNPEFRDQDLAPARLGELLVYGRLFGRGLGVFGRVYLHVFADMYTGHIFGRLSQDKRVSAGLSLLTSTVIPSYQSRNYAIDTILHSTQNDNDIDEINSLKSSFAFSAQSLQWLSTRRNFGVLEKLERYLVQNSFFENPPALFKNLQSRLERRIAKYNASNRWFARRIIY